MDVVQNLKAFLAVARTGSFTGASRLLGIAPSVTTKRINQLEQRTRARLFSRTTRRVELSEIGRRYLPRIERLIEEFDETLDAMASGTDPIQGHLRLQAPAALTMLYLRDMLADFRAAHPRLTLEIVLAEPQPAPPVGTADFDVVIGSASEPDDRRGLRLCPVRDLVCASPAYLRARGAPRHPSELVDHDCLAFLPTGTSWAFAVGRLHIEVAVSPRFASNDPTLLLDAARDGAGVVRLPEYQVLSALQAGDLVQVLADYPTPERWLSAVTPRGGALDQRVRTLFDHLRRRFEPTNPPWRRPGRLPP